MSAFAYYDDDSSSDGSDEEKDAANNAAYRQWLNTAEAHRVVAPEPAPSSFPRNVAFQCDCAALLADALSLLQPQMPELLKGDAVDTVRVRVEGLLDDVVFDLRETARHADAPSQIWHGARQACLKLGVAPLVWRWGEDGSANVNYKAVDAMDLDTIEVLRQSYLIRSVQTLSAAADSLRHKVNAWGFKHEKVQGGWERLTSQRGEFKRTTHPNSYPTARVPPPNRNRNRNRKRKRGCNPSHDHE